MANGVSQYPSGVDTDDNLLNLKDRSTTFLSSDISDSDTSITVVSAVNFPSGVQIITIGEERILCSSRSGNTFTVDTRGFSDSTSAPHLANAKVSGNWTAHHHNNIKNALIATQTKLNSVESNSALKSRLINTTSPLQGGGDLTTDRTLTIIPATPSVPGSMSATDKSKLDGIANNANNYVHPNHSGDVVSTGDGATVIQSGAVTDSKLSTGINANKIANGSVSNAEFQYLDGVTSGIQTQLNAKQPLDSDLTAIANLAPPNDDILQRKAGVWQNRTPTQFKTDLTLVKADVGLGNVDNTSDLAKPISTATQTALDVKIANSFETVTTNLRSYPVIDSTFVPGVSLSKTYSTPGGNIVITTNFSGGKPSTKVLSGAGLPNGIATTKTYDFTGRTVPLVSYT
jgi:hypothetical protein